MLRILGFAVLIAVTACHILPETSVGSPPAEFEPPPRRDAPRSGGTASPIDWEVALDDLSARRIPPLRPDLTSTRGLAETTAWMQWALEQYGYLPQGEFSTSRASFDGCAMTWTTLQYFDSRQMLNETIHRINLKDIDISYGLVHPTGDSVRISTHDAPAGLLRLQERFWKKDGSRLVSRAADRFTNERTAVIPLSRADAIPHRFAAALVHSVNLCGGRGRLQ